MNIRNSSNSFCRILGCLLALALGAAGALAADITVDADCSLANALRAANGQAMAAPRDSCEAGDSDGIDTITLELAGTVDGSIALDGSLSVTSPIAIEGRGYTLNGNGHQLFNVSAGSLSLSNITLTNGYSAENGGAISVIGAELQLYNSVVRNSGARGWGGGIYVLNSDALIIGSAIHDNSAGPDAHSSVAHSHSALDDEGLSAQSAEEHDEYHAQSDLPTIFGHSGGGLYIAGQSSSLTVRQSGFSNNRSAEDGGGISIYNASVTIENSTISDNHAAGRGGGIYNEGSTVLRHVTVVNNWAAAGGIADSGSLQLYNSIASGNSGGDCDGALNANLGNLIADGSCNHDGLTGEPALLLLAGAPSYYAPAENSAVIDAGAADFCSETDQRNILRSPGACDIGAAEYQAGAFEFQRQSAQASAPATSSGGDDANDSAAEAPRTSLCETLPGHVLVKDFTYSTQCKLVDYAGVGNALLVNSGAIHAVDIFGWVATPMTVCFLHEEGGIVLLDAATMPRNIVPLRTWTENAWQCATVDRTGTAVLMPTDFFTSGGIPEPYWDLENCQVRTLEILNLRSAPSANSDILGNVLFDVRLPADQRATHFYRVQYYDLVGWLSQDYLAFEGDCI